MGRSAVSLLLVLLAACEEPIIVISAERQSVDFTVDVQVCDPKAVCPDAGASTRPDGGTCTKTSTIFDVGSTKVREVAIYFHAPPDRIEILFIQPAGSSRLPVDLKGQPRPIELGLMFHPDKSPEPTTDCDACGAVKCW